mgnify:CR=1 FL=1|jgi:hypothetical protein
MQSSHYLLSVLLIALLCGRSILLQGAPLVADRYTLLLAGFEDGVEQPDYSVGPSAFFNSGAVKILEGYYGCGLDLRPHFPSQKNLRIYNRWALMMEGNILPDEGTFEFFVNLKNSPAPYSQPLLNAFVGRFIDDGKTYVGTYLYLSDKKIRWRFPIWSRDTREHWSGEIDFLRDKQYGGEALSKDWHHLAIAWASGEALLFLDGRLLASCNLKGKFGLTLLNNLSHGMHMSGYVIDELRISSIARYKNNFEPNWRNGKRPINAFTTSQNIRRYPVEYRIPPSPINKMPSGIKINKLDCALLMYEGYDRQILEGAKPQLFGSRFEQQFDAISVDGTVEDATDGVKLFKLNIRNGKLETQRLELQFAVKPDFKAAEYFDGAEVRRHLSLPRYRSGYIFILPLGAVADSSDFVATGLSPRFPYNDLVHGWSPEGILSVGVKFVLAPGEEFTVTFYSARGKSKFGTDAALDQYYNCFADLYKRPEKSTVYSYLSPTGHWRIKPSLDIVRQGYAGSFWGHGPAHTKGDEPGKWWEMEKYLNAYSYKHARHSEEKMETRENLHELIAAEHKFEFDNAYPVRRFHIAPDLTPEWIIKELAPDLLPSDDPLVTGQYYKRINGNYFVNEYDTPFGAHFRRQMKEYFELGMRGTSPGWINDILYVASVMRFNDPLARKTSGRSFSADMGDFVRGAMGKQQRMEEINKMTCNKYPMSIIADGGLVSYTVGAYACQAAIESGDIFLWLYACNYVKYGRQIFGEKPISAHSSPQSFALGNHLQSSITPEMLRELLRDSQRRIINFSLKHAILLDPFAYNIGKQYIMEQTPLLVEASIRGRKAVPAGWVNQPGWIRRSGEGTKSLIIIGNDSNQEFAAKVKLDNDEFDGTPLPVDFFGGYLAGQGSGESIEFKHDIPAQSVWGLLTPLIVSRTRVSGFTTAMRGDGVDFTVVAEINCDTPATLKFDDFAPLYSLYSLQINGVENNSASKLIQLSQGYSKIELKYHCTPLYFSAEELSKIELIKDGRCNFVIIADSGYHYRKLDRNFKLGFDQGTAMMLTDFIRLYDWEDGILDNMGLPEWHSQPIAETSRWQFILQSKAEHNGASIDQKKKHIIVKGTTPGEARRVMVILMRMIDRKYPRLGSLIPLDFYKGRFDRNHSWKNTAFGKHRDMKFFLDFSDQDFLLKPVLSRENEILYQNENCNFADRYKLKFPPFIVEPTYTDNFVYGFDGENKFSPKPL